ncbi:MAG: hypothetical protein NUW22_09200, partial [Acidobacteria bacterium]|nr:hypothetical protein [Acidobacteriota bacterium]
MTRTKGPEGAVGTVTAAFGGYLAPILTGLLIVAAGATAFVATALSMVLLLYLRRLRKATATIDRLVA